jgi:hypothetical protein
MSDGTLTLLSALLGAVVGAVVGGIISFLIQINGVRVARNERLAVKRQEDLANALAVMVKVIRMLSNLHHIREAIAESQARFATLGPGREFWHAMLPFGTIPTSVEVTSGESAFILSTKDRDLMLAATELADAHNDFLRLVARYSERREALTATFAAEQVHGNSVISSVGPEELTRFMPRIIELRTLTAAMIPRSEEHFNQAQHVFNHLRAYGSARFGKDFPPLEIMEVARPARP